MSSKKPNKSDVTNNSNASDVYRAAFERLKINQPNRLPIGTSVTQNNVAREAGSCPSALKKARYPLLIIEIKKYVENNVKSKSQLLIQEKEKRKKRTLREKLDAVTQQRDILASKLYEADMTIVELKDNISKLELEISSTNKITLLTQSNKKY